MHAPLPKQWDTLSLIPVAAGLFWLFGGQGLGWLLWGLIPGALLLATGLSLLFWPGEGRLTAFLAAGGVVGLLLGVPAMFAGGFWTGLLALGLSLASYLAAGRIAAAQLPLAEGVPAPDTSLGMDAKIALDEALLAYFVGFAHLPSGELAQKAAREALQLENALEEGGWLRDPLDFHAAPPPPDGADVLRRKLFGREFEQLRYRSGFVPRETLPGAQAWVNLHPNNECSAWMLRHRDGAPRPWLICVHGYRMGLSWMDFGLFPPGVLHDRLGLNLLMPTLPLHGCRKIGMRTGDQFLDGDPLDLVHALSQTLWDLRRAIRWIRAQEPDARIGVLGYSLGGYSSALLANFEKDLDFVIAGIPVVDFAEALWRHLPPAHKRYFSSQGFDEERYRRILTAVSPLAAPPVLAPERRYIFAGVGDRVVPLTHPMKLARHWDVPVQWYQGGHLTFRGEYNVRGHIEAAMQRAGWATTARAQHSAAA